MSFSKGTTSKNIYQPKGSEEEGRDDDGGKVPAPALQVIAVLGVAPAEASGAVWDGNVVCKTITTILGVLLIIRRI